jgi:hypothetical protein
MLDLIRKRLQPSGMEFGGIEYLNARDSLEFLSKDIVERKAEAEHENFMGPGDAFHTLIGG